MGKKGGKMPRVARKNSKSYYYHVIVQGINKEYIFEREKYIKKYMQIISKKLEDSKVLILAYCIMNNHAHFLMHAEKVEYISKYMQKVNITYSQFYNNEKNRVGYVFRNRYYSQEIGTQRQLYNCLNYIHNNPVKANIVNSVGEYQYSSYNEFLGKKMIINNKGIYLLFGSNEGDEPEKNGITEAEKFIFINSENYKYDDSEFLDIKEKEFSDFMAENEKKYNEKWENIKNDKRIVKTLIKDAKKQTDVTIVELSKIFGISKSTVGRYLKE